MILLFCVSKHQAKRYGTKLSLTGDIPVTGNYYATNRIATHGAVVVTFQNLVSRTLVARCKNNQLLKDTIPSVQEKNTCKYNIKSFSSQRILNSGAYIPISYWSAQELKDISSIARQFSGGFEPLKDRR
jgi:hypothetical protein